ncbi:MAG: hypothetical protein ABIZ04_21505, partial [Opitutus sp.]
ITGARASALAYIGPVKIRVHSVVQSNGYASVDMFPTALRKSSDCLGIRSSTTSLRLGLRAPANGFWRGYVAMGPTLFAQKSLIARRSNELSIKDDSLTLPCLVRPSGNSPDLKITHAAAMR